jgi:hypothetical protein
VPLARQEAWCNVRDVEGLLASVVLIAILLGVLLVVVFDVFCLLRLGTSDTAHFVPRLAWAVLIVGTSPVGGLVYLLAQRLRKRSPEPVTMRPRPLLGSKAWYGPAPARGGSGRSPASPEGHAVAVVAIAGAVYLVLAGKVLDAAAVAVVLVIIVFLKSTPSPGARERNASQDRRDQRPEHKTISRPLPPAASRRDSIPATSFHSGAVRPRLDAGPIGCKGPQ